MTSNLARDLAHDLASALTLDQAHALQHDLTSALTMDLTRALNDLITSAVAVDLARALTHGLKPSTLDMDLTCALKHPPTSDLSRHILHT